MKGSGEAQRTCRNSWCIEFSVDFLPKPFQSHCISSFVPVPPYPNVVPILNLSFIVWPQLSINPQMPALRIPQSWRHKPPFSSPTLCRLLENRDTSWRSHCIKSICLLNLLQTGSWIRPAFSLLLLLFSKPGECASASSDVQ